MEQSSEWSAVVSVNVCVGVCHKMVINVECRVLQVPLPLEGCQMFSFCTFQPFVVQY